MNQFKIGDRVKVTNMEDDRDLRRIEGKAGEVLFAPSEVDLVFIRLDDVKHTMSVRPYNLALEPHNTEAATTADETIRREVVDFYYAACEQQTENVLEEVAKYLNANVVNMIRHSIKTTNPKKVLELLEQRVTTDTEATR